MRKEKREECGTHSTGMAITGMVVYPRRSHRKETPFLYALLP